MDKQIAVIKYLKKAGLFNQLKAKEQMICNYRLKYKDNALNGLAIQICHDEHNPSYTSKSDLAYLFNKLTKIAIVYKQHHEK
ncbi:hypothetical protein II941_02110 [bacterium]|nr:hypothetical protein [bacterium]